MHCRSTETLRVSACVIKAFLLPIIAMKLAAATTGPRPTSTPTSIATVCGGGSTAKSAHGAMFLDFHGAHHVEHHKQQNVQGETVASEQVPTRSIGHDDAG